MAFSKLDYFSQIWDTQRGAGGEYASQNLFFHGECLSKFIFSWRRASEIFFLIPSAPPPRSLLLVPVAVHRG